MKAVVVLDFRTCVSHRRVSRVLLGVALLGRRWRSQFGTSISLADMGDRQQLS